MVRKSEQPAADKKQRSTNQRPGHASLSPRYEEKTVQPTGCSVVCSWGKRAENWSTRWVRCTSDSWRIWKARGVHVARMLGNGTSVLGVRTVRKGNGKDKDLIRLRTSKWRQKKRKYETIATWAWFRGRKEQLDTPKSACLCEEKYIRWAKGDIWRCGSDLTRCRLWQAQGFEAMEEGVSAIAKTPTFQSEHMHLKTIFFADRD